LSYFYFFDGVKVVIEFSIEKKSYPVNPAWAKRKILKYAPLPKVIHGVTKFVAKTTSFFIFFNLIEK